MTERKKPEVGQTLYSLNIGNAARRCEQVLTPVKVCKVGRKYFTVGEGRWREVQYYLHDWSEKTDYCANSRLYETEQEYFDEKECSKLSDYIYEHFEYRRNVKNISLESLRKIRDIIQSETGESQ